MMWVALLAILAAWSAAIVWALWRARWIGGAVSELSAAVVIILVARSLGPPQPVAYGLALGLSIFLAAVMTMMGVIAAIMRWLASRD
ncbi:hypothetical protein D9601_09775 [Sphingomonas sp. MA1305]|uniref:hypothetical protein n=1 Tax=Sphingomonas sp. MA1305 TaxID=2479204 RepID=UPI0018DF4D4D|nr:hypothetical protein [Sphingomonas sp. MA1305]MBI0475639.1 hypothetical protein [Sphingomonas sp. MA1305]